MGKLCQVLQPLFEAYYRNSLISLTVGIFEPEAKRDLMSPHHFQ
jgi:hypothetical protein